MKFGCMLLLLNFAIFRQIVSVIKCVEKSYAPNVSEMDPRCRLLLDFTCKTSSMVMFAERASLKCFNVSCDR